MGNLLKLPFALRLSSILALCALIFSFSIGLISGIAIGIVLLKTLIFTVVFFGLGFGVSEILQRFIPELYTVVAAPSEEQQLAGAYSDTMPNVDDSASERYEMSGDEEGADTAAPSTFDPGLDTESTVQRSSTMGKHLLKEKGFKYEPKIMAEAIRTMMSRDDS